MAKTKGKGTRGKATKKAGTTRAATKTRKTRKAKKASAKSFPDNIMPTARRGVATAKAQLKKIKRKVQRAF